MAQAGILPYQALLEMAQSGAIAAATPLAPAQIQPASIDLRLGAYAYPVSTSFLPGRGVKVLEKMKRLDDRFESFRLSLADGAVLEKGRVYVIPLQESLHLQNDVAAFANPKSSTGRLDILTRLIADGSVVFDQVEKGYQGQLYLEVAPRSFSVVVKTGATLNQLRFCRQREEAALAFSHEEWNRLLEENQIAVNGDPAALAKTRENKGLLSFTVDLMGSDEEGSLIGWRAKKNAKRLDLEQRDCDPLEYWDPLYFYKEPCLTLDPNEFYILMTREAIAVPPDFAAEMIPYDTRAGEFRVHYAGFFDPGFGWNAALGKAGASRGVLEVRSHEVPFLLEHGQIVGWLKYERMAAPPAKLYGQEIASNYQGQDLKLAKQFRALSRH
ncbi:MAG: 2'-deoxycytidine 5'-triphosphate deaminase [Alphaproteobacteria bacterium]|nr:2'-deoxycytidine 5'-triphosphate deaminase [Alphaproteobacteria bacterium]